MHLRLAMAGGLLAIAATSFAAPLEIPLRVPLETIGKALAAQLAGPAARPNELYREGACRYLNLEPPTLKAIADGRLSLSGPGSAALGMELGGKCANAAAWKGSV